LTESPNHYRRQYMHMYTLTRWMVVQQYNNASFYQTIYTLYPYM